MFDKVTSEEYAPLDYEERQAILEELAREEYEAHATQEAQTQGGAEIIHPDAPDALANDEEIPF